MSAYEIRYMSIYVCIYYLYICTRTQREWKCAAMHFVYIYIYISFIIDDVHMYVYIKVYGSM